MKQTLFAVEDYKEHLWVCGGEERVHMFVRQPNGRRVERRAKDRGKQKILLALQRDGKANCTSPFRQTRQQPCSYLPVSSAKSEPVSTTLSQHYDS
jgi:hypothetical protein